MVLHMRADLLKAKMGSKRLKNVIHASEQNGYVYISNPKAACSTIKLYLARCEKNDKEYSPVSLHKRLHLPFDNLGKLTSQKLNILLNGNYFVFTFVRHPFKRAVSAYGDKILGNRFQKKEILRLLGKNPEDLNSFVSFNDFVKAITSQKTEDLNPHWRPQVLNLYPSLIRYDFIGKLEAFDQDLKQVRYSLGLPDFPMHRQNVKSSRADPKRLLNPWNRLKLARLYAKDFVQFGYRPKGIEYLGLLLGFLPGLPTLNLGRFRNSFKRPRKQKIS